MLDKTDVEPTEKTEYVPLSVSTTFLIVWVEEFVKLQTLLVGGATRGLVELVKLQKFVQK